jgi:hypothetical protein
MDIAQVQSGQVGMAIFDMWEASVRKSHKSHKTLGSPLVAAAAEAFEQYIQTAEIGMAAQISGVAMYALSPCGHAASPITTQQMAPFLALNVMA